MEPIVLASASPRRRELLIKMGLEPLVRAADIDES
ncbi:MAG: Maf family protein, partial [Spirochaetales bacterium]|nr:Maf family protein [Spirochaetales bacterium]